MKRIFKITVCCLLAVLALMPDASAERRRRRTVTGAEAETTQVQTMSRSERRRSVTQATQEAAINASQTPAASNSGSPALRANRPAKSQKTTATKPAGKAQGGAKSKIKVSKPDLEAIRQATLNPKNKFYYPNLMAKYNRKDTLMTPEEYRYLYLGYMFQEDYDPYRQSPFTEKTDELRGKDTYTKAELDTIRKYAQKSLEDNPFDLRQMSFLVHALKAGRKDAMAKIWEYRLENLLAAIKSTGTGESAQNAWFVIYPMHEYDMVQLLGYRAVDIDYAQEGYDHLLVEPDGSVKISRPAKGFYFNVLVPQQQYELKHPEEFTGNGGAEE